MAAVVQGAQPERGNHIPPPQAAPRINSLDRALAWGVLLSKCLWKFVLVDFVMDNGLAAGRAGETGAKCCALLFPTHTLQWILLLK